MTTMPDLIAQTRIFRNIERLFDEPSTDVAELKRWQEAIKADPRISVLMDVIRQQNGGRYVISDADFEHLRLHVFNHPDPADNARHGWWGDDVENIATEAMAHLAEHMIYDQPYHNDKRLLDEPRRVTALWLCPATFYFRSIIVRTKRNPDWITWMIITPPKPDHPKHYNEYKNRQKTREDHLDTPTPYDLAEEIWVTSADEDSVTMGKDRHGADVNLSSVMPSITGLPKVETVQLLSERY